MVGLLNGGNMRRRNFVLASIFAGTALDAVTARSNGRPITDSPAVIDRFFAGYSSRQLEACMDCFSSSGDVFAYGSAIGEKRIGLDAIRLQLEQDWAQSQETYLKVIWRKVDEAGAVSWIAADVAGNTKISGNQLAIEARATFVLRREFSHWKIVQMHFSVPSG